MTTRRMEITVETERVIVLSRRGSLALAWCRECSTQVGTFSINDAVLAGFSPQAICRWAEAGKFHVVEPVGEPSFICLNSILERL